MNNEYQKSIQSLTLADKIALLSGDGGHAVCERVFKQKFLTMKDGPHGVQGSGKCYPNVCLTSCSWDKKLVYDIGVGLGADCLHNGVDVLLAPGVNLKRHPLCGRNFEYFSEDPVLTGYLAAEIVKGIQSNGKTAACVKHFLANNQEAERFSNSVYMDEKTLKDLYAAAFGIIIRESGPKVVMMAYNRFNGVFCAENEYLYKVLRDELGFKGVTVSDWGGCDSRVRSMLVGLDMDMPGANAKTSQSVEEAVKSGVLDEKIIDSSLSRVLDLLEECRQGESEFSDKETDMVTIVEESAVLLKNNGVLPLKKSIKLGIVGKNAVSPVVQGGGCAKVNSDKISAPRTALEQYAEDTVFVLGYDGKKIDVGFENDKELLKDCDAVIIFLGTEQDDDCEACDRKDIALSTAQLQVFRETAALNENTIAVLTNGSVLDLNEVDEKSAAVLECYYPGEGFAVALCNILFGKANPSGRLCETFPEKLSDCKAANNYDANELNIVYGEKEEIGYRDYVRNGKKVLYPFGYGLSYTRFEYSDVEAHVENGGVVINCKISNVGDFDGKEVVQAYLDGELKAFEKVFIKSGETAEVTLEMKDEDVKRFDLKVGKRVPPSGRHEVSINKNAVQKIAGVTVDFGKRFVVTRYTTVDDFLKNGLQSMVEKYLKPYIGKTVFGNPDVPIKFKDDKVVGGNPDKYLIPSLPLRLFVSLSGGMLSDGELDELISVMQKEADGLIK